MCDRQRDHNGFNLQQLPRGHCTAAGEYSMIDVFKICKGISKIRLNDLFYFDDSGKGT